MDFHVYCVLIATVYISAFKLGVSIGQSSHVMNEPLNPAAKQHDIMNVIFCNPVFLFFFFFFF